MLLQTLRKVAGLLLVLGLCYTSAHAASVDTALVTIFGHEGGLQCSKSDPGNKRPDGTYGCTNFGIAANTYPYVDIKHLTIKQAAAFYKRDFWNPLHLSELESQGIATELLDTAVNCGVGTSANNVLKLINYLAPAHYKLNGRVNSEQIEWLNKYTRKKVNRTKVWKILNVFQAERYMQIINKNERMRKYENSWFSRVGL